MAQFLLVEVMRSNLNLTLRNRQACSWDPFLFTISCESPKRVLQSTSFAMKILCLASAEQWLRHPNP